MEPSSFSLPRSHLISAHRKHEQEQERNDINVDQTSVWNRLAGCSEIGAIRVRVQCHGFSNSTGRLREPRGLTRDFNIRPLVAYGAVYTGFSSQGRVRLRAFPPCCGAENTQLGPSWTRKPWGSIHMAKISSRESSRKSSRKNFTSKSYNKKIKLDFGKILGKIFWPCELTSSLSTSN